MIYIILIMVCLMALTMAKARGRRGGRGRNMKMFQKLRVSTFLSVGAIGNGIVEQAALTAVLQNEYRVTSVDVVWAMRDHTAAEGPITVGFSHPDYTDTEVLECLTASVLSPSHKVQQEQESRLVRVVGTFPGILAEESLNDGKPIKTKLNWLVADGDVACNIFALNSSGATLTDGSDIVVTGQINGFWI